MADSTEVNPLCPRVPIAIGGETYWLRCTLLAWYRFEQATGHPIYELRLDLPEALTLVWSMLLPDQPELAEEHVGAAEPGEFNAAVIAAVKLLSEMQPRCDDPPAPADEKKEPARMDWRRLWAAARLRLRLSDAEFWSLAPWQLFELQKQSHDAQEEALWGHAMVCSATVNCHIDPDKTEPYAPAFFMPGAIGKAEALRRDREQAKGLSGKLADFAKVMGAQVIKLPAPEK